MQKTNFELFKQALDEAVSNQFDRLANQCDEEIVHSKRHSLVMQTIVQGKHKIPRTLAIKIRQLIAVLVAAAILLTSCILFRDEISEIFKDFFVSITFESNDEFQQIIKDIYHLSYIPDGYKLEKTIITKMCVQYKFANESGSMLYFEQRALTLSDYYIDSEKGYSKIKEIEEYDIYYRFTDKNHLYVWRNEEYLVSIKSSLQLSNKEIILLINGIKSN